MDNRLCKLNTTSTHKYTPYERKRESGRAGEVWKEGGWRLPSIPCRFHFQYQTSTYPVQVPSPPDSHPSPVSSHFTPKLSPIPSKSHPSFLPIPCRLYISCPFVSLVRLFDCVAVDMYFAEYRIVFLTLSSILLYYDGGRDGFDLWARGGGWLVGGC